MNKRLVIIFGISILLAGGLVYLWQTTKRIDSSVIFLEEAGGALFAKLQNLRPLPGNTGKGTICESILDLETARMLELSVDGGSTWWFQVTRRSVPIPRYLLQVRAPGR